MLRITVYDKQQALTLQLEGRLAGPWVHVLEECWQSSLVRHRRPILRVDLAGVTFIDEAGQACLAAMHREGAELIAADAMTKAIAAEIAQGPRPLNTEVRRAFGASEGQDEMTLKRVTNPEVKTMTSLELTKMKIATNDRRTTSAKNVALWTLQILTAAAFLMAGFATLSGYPMMVATFDKIGIGQWFRYLTGGIEVTSAILLLIPRAAPVAAALLVCTMLGAVLSHLFLIGGSPVPALVLLCFATIILWGRFETLKSLLSRKTVFDMRTPGTGTAATSPSNAR